MRKKYQTDEERKAARREYFKQYYQNNAEHIKERSKQYYHDNTDNIKERKKQYYHDNADSIKERSKKWREQNEEYFKQYYHDNAEYFKQYYQDNAERRKEYYKQYYRENTEYYKQHYRENTEYYKQYQKDNPIGRANSLITSYRESDKKYNRGECTLTTKWIIEKIFSNSCHYCGESNWKRLGCDRIDNTKPHTQDNVVPCCFSCNCKRGKKDYNMFVNEIKHKGYNQM